MTRWKLGDPHRKNSNPNMLEGLPAIATFLGKSLPTARRWIMSDGLPATKLPSGRWLTHKALVLQWIYAGHQAFLKNNCQYILEPEEIADLAKRMGIEPDEVLTRIQHDQRINPSERASKHEAFERTARRASTR